MDQDRHIIVADGGQAADEQPATEAAEASYDIEAPDVLSTRTAFLVYVNNDGKAIATSNLNLPLVTEREADVVDMRRACAEVVDDVNIMLTTQQIVSAQMAVAQQMAKQAQTDAIVAQLNGGGANGVPILGQRH